MPDASNWPTFGSSVVVPLGFASSGSSPRSRCGCSTRGCGSDSRWASSPTRRAPRRYAGMRTRRKILAVMAVSGAHRRDRRREPDRRLHAHARRQPDGPAGGGVRLHGDRRRRARALQPVRGLPRRGADRRAPERRVHAAGAGLPVGARRRDAGDHPVLRLSAASCSFATGFGSRGARVRASRPRRRRHERQRQPARDRARAGRALRHAAPLRGARRAPRRSAPEC